DICDSPAEVVAERLGRPLTVAPPGVQVPAEQVVAADPPVAAVGLCRVARAGTNQLAVDVQCHVVRAAGRVVRRDHVVPSAVVVNTGRLNGLDLPVPDTEHKLAVVHHVDIAVVGGAQAGLSTAEADELATSIRGGREPAFDRERERASDRSRGVTRPLRPLSLVAVPGTPVIGPAAPLVVPRS